MNSSIMKRINEMPMCSDCRDDTICYRKNCRGRFVDSRGNVKNRAKYNPYANVVYTDPLSEFFSFVASYIHETLNDDKFLPSLKYKL